MFICDRCGVVKEECAGGVKTSCMRWRLKWALRYDITLLTHGLCLACVEVEACRHPGDCGLSLGAGEEKPR